VSNFRNQLRINIGFLLIQPIGYRRDFHLEFPEIFISPDLVLLDFNGLARINRTPQGLLVNGEIQTELNLECVRCLVPYRQALHTTFDELYAFSRRSTTESGLIVPEDGYIDLQPLVRDYLLIEIPISPLCQPDCLGLCPVCGANRNTENCAHKVFPGRVENKHTAM
jgi:uncharacterized protein